MASATPTKVPVVWRTKRSEADRLLGKVGRPVLDQVIELLRKVAKDQEWPLQRINIRYHQDMEDAEWENIRVIPVFRASSEQAREYMRAFYPEADAFRDSLGTRQRRKLVRVLGFGYETV